MKFLIVDDHSLLRDGLTALLRQLGDDITVLAAPDGASALAMLAQAPDLDAAIIDLTLPGMHGVALLETFAARVPDLPLIVLSASENAGDVRRAMAAGALGYVPKSASPQTLLSAIRMVLAGELYVPPLVLDEAPNPATQAPKLTMRQSDVLACMGRGLTNKATACELNMSEKTVKAHVTAILRALGATNRVQAIAIAREQAMIA